MSEHTVFYVVQSEKFGIVKFGISSGDGQARLRAHRRDGLRKVHRLMTGMRPGDARRLEDRALALMASRGLQPTAGREYFPREALEPVLKLVDGAQEQPETFVGKDGWSRVAERFAAIPRVRSDFWEETPTLGLIRLHADRMMVAPEGMLHCALAEIAAVSTSTVRGEPLQWGGFLYGPSGAGKGLTRDGVRGLLPGPRNTWSGEMRGFDMILTIGAVPKSFPDFCTQVWMDPTRRPVHQEICEADWTDYSVDPPLPPLTVDGALLLDWVRDQEPVHYFPGGAAAPPLKNGLCEVLLALLHGRSYPTAADTWRALRLASCTRRAHEVGESAVAALKAYRRF